MSNFTLITEPSEDGFTIGGSQTFVHKIELADKPVQLVAAIDYEAQQDMSILMWFSKEPMGIKVPKTNDNLTTFTLLDDATELFLVAEGVLDPLADKDSRNLILGPQGTYYINFQNRTGKDNGYKLYLS